MTKNTDSQTPYVDFHTKHKVSPVAQDISDLGKHYSRRELLYRRLGIIPAYLNEKTVLEFGPGSGHNSLYTYSLKPSKFVLVDANPTGLGKCKELLTTHFSNETQHRFSLIESLVEDYRTDEKFDLVLAEGFIPATTNPRQMLETIANYTVPGGVCVITCHDHISLLADNIRGFLGSLYTNDSMSLKEQIDILLIIFKDHFRSLKGMSRSREDWIVDNVIHKSLWRDASFLSIEEAITSLKDKFDILGSSPSFITDWRWYKDVYGEQNRFNEVAIYSYQNNLHNFLDFRTESIPREKILNKRLLKFCEETTGHLRSFSKEKNHSSMSKLCESIGNLIVETETFSPVTAQALRDLNSVLEKYPNLDPGADWKTFPDWWGRGMQYASFLRNF